MWTFLVGLILVLLGVFFFWIVKVEIEDSGRVLGAFFLVFGGIWLFVSVIALPVDRFSHYAFIEQFEATRSTVMDIRECPDISALERLSLQKEIIERNEELAEKQYYSRNYWTNLYFPKELQEVKPIRNFNMSEKEEVRKNE